MAERTSESQEALLMVLNELFRDMDYATIISFSLASVGWNEKIEKIATQLYGKATPVAHTLLSKGRRYIPMQRTFSPGIGTLPLYREALAEWDLLIQNHSFVEKLFTDEDFLRVRLELDFPWPSFLSADSSAVGDGSDKRGMTWAKATLFNRVFLLTLLYDIASDIASDAEEPSRFAALTLKYINFIAHRFDMLYYIAFAEKYQNLTSTSTPQSEDQAPSLKKSLFASGSEGNRIIMRFSPNAMENYQQYLKQKKIEKAEGDPFSWEKNHN